MESYFYERRNKQSCVKRLTYEIRFIENLTVEILSARLENGLKQNMFFQTRDRPASGDSPYMLQVGFSEELYKRVSEFLLALVQYVNETTGSAFPLAPVIFSPQYSTLPSICSMLWKRLQMLKKIETEGKKNPAESPFSVENAETMSSKGSQTNSSSLLFCESCHMSMNLIKSLVHRIQIEQRKLKLRETHVSAFRKKLANDVFEISQWGAMAGWTEAVGDDFDWAVSVLTETKKHCHELNKAKEAMKKEHTKTVTAFQNNLTLTRKQLEAEQAQCNYLNTQVEELNLSLKRRIEYEGNLVKDINDYRQRQELLIGSMKCCKSASNKLKMTQISINNFVKFSLARESRNISDALENFSAYVKNVEQRFIEKMEKQKKEEAETRLRLNETKDLISQLKQKNSIYEEDRKQINEKKDQEIIRIREAEREIIDLKRKLEESKAREKMYQLKLESTCKIQLNFSGDPLRDMENQRQANKRKIKALITENTSLKTIINKLKTL